LLFNNLNFWIWISGNKNTNYNKGSIIITHDINMNEQ